MARKAVLSGAMEVIDKEKPELYKVLDIAKDEIIPKIGRAVREFRPLKT